MGQFVSQSKTLNAMGRQKLSNFFVQQRIKVHITDVLHQESVF